MEKPKVHRSGRPICGEQIKYILFQNGGTMQRRDIRNLLQEMGYQGYCIEEAFKSLAGIGQIELIGSSKSPYQIVNLTHS